jgi:hypothetical protein
VTISPLSSPSKSAFIETEAAPTLHYSAYQFIKNALKMQHYTQKPIAEYETALLELTRRTQKDEEQAQEYKEPAEKKCW